MFSLVLMRKNGNLSEIKAIIFSQLFLKSRKFLLDTRKDFLKTNDFYLVEILSEPNNLTILTSKKILKMTNHVQCAFWFVKRVFDNKTNPNNFTWPGNWSEKWRITLEDYAKALRVGGWESPQWGRKGKFCWGRIFLFNCGNLRRSDIYHWNPYQS